MEWWSDYRVSPLKILPSRARYGDIYSACFLPGFMDTSTTKLKTHTSGAKNIDLYILHDSYFFGRIQKENFKNLNKLVLSDFRGEGIYVKLNQAKKNILIVECSERYANWRLSDTGFIFSRLHVGKPATLTKNSKKIEGEQFSKYLFNPFINQNLEYNLFDYELFKPIKECKALVNYNLFNRIMKDVSISLNNKYLLLNETINPNLESSSFRYISNEEIDFIVKRINLIKNHYQSKGFTEVYFSIIPNPVSIIEPGRLNYNHKVERIEFTTFLKTDYIDVYGVFRLSKKQVFRRDDSHWNNYGLQLWLNEANAKITKP